MASNNSAGSAQVQNLLARLRNVKEVTGGWKALCPAHNDHNPSLSISCGDDGKVLLKCFAGCNWKEILVAIGLQPKDLFPANGDPPCPCHWRGEPLIDCYVYQKANGSESFSVGRTADKEFPVWCRGSWGLKGKKVEKVLYRLHEVISAKQVFIVEGEKNVENLSALGVTATTCLGGAGKWKAEYSEFLKGKHLIIFPDNDEPGLRHAKQVAMSTYRQAASVKVVRLTGLPTEGDVSDWLEQFTDPEAAKLDLLRLVEAAEQWRPSAKSNDKNLGVLLSTVQPSRVRWLWKNRIPLGKLSILDGDPGVGKSLISLDLSARVSKGMPMPGGQDGMNGGVVIITAEDGLSDTVRPRLEAAGADLGRILALRYIPENDGDITFSRIPGDIPTIEAAIQQIQAKLVVVDPLTAYLSEEVNSFRDQDVRLALSPLAQMAEKTDTAILIIRHLNKQRTGSALYRGGGSIGIIAAVRSGMLVGRDPENPTRYILAMTKANLSQMATSLTYEIETDNNVPHIRWRGESSLVADEILSNRNRGLPRQEARQFLKAVLNDGPVLATQIFAEAQESGISSKTLKRAKSDLGVKSEKVGFDSGGWSWVLPQAEYSHEEGQYTTGGPLRGENQTNSLFKKELVEGGHDVPVGQPDCEGGQVVDTGEHGPLRKERRKEFFI